MELKDKVKAKLIESLNEDVYKVEHEGHPDADKIKELSHLKPGKKYCNHITKYPESAKKAAAMLKKNGFQGVKIYKNWQVMEGVELPEVELDEATKPSAWRISLGGKEHPVNRVPIEHHDEFKKQFKGAVVRFRGPRKGKDNTSKADATHFSIIDPGHMHSGHSGWQAIRNVNEEAELDESIVTKAHDAKYDELMKKGYKPHSLGPKNAPGVQSHIMKHKDTGEKIHLHTWQKSISDVGQNVETLKEEVELDEGRMSELHADIGQHMDKHISNYKRVGGAESLMAHAARATPKIAKLHGIEHKHAEKFVSDYIDSKLHEESLNEVSKSTLGSYIKKAIPSSKEAEADAKAYDTASAFRKMATRKKGINTAIDKLVRKEEAEIEEGKDPFAGTPWSSSKTKKKLIDQVKKRIGMDKPETKDPKSVVKDGKRVFEEAELEEAYTVKTYKGSPDEVSKHLGLAAKSSKTRIRNDGTIEVHEKSSNGVNIHNVWSEDEGKTSKYTVKTMSAALYKKNHGKLNEGLFAKKAKPDAMDDVYAKAKAHVAVKHPGWKLASLGRGDNGSINYEVMHPTTGATREGVIKEETLSEEIKIGDSVHVGLVKKGGTGFEGVVTHMDQANNKITLRSHTKEKFGHRTFQGRLSNASVINK